MIITSKLNSSIVFSLAIFWDRGPTEWKAEGRGSRADDKSRRPRVEEHKHPFYYNQQLRKTHRQVFIVSYLFKRKLLIEKKVAAIESYS